MSAGKRTGGMRALALLFTMMIAVMLLPMSEGTHVRAETLESAKLSTEGEAGRGFFEDGYGFGEMNPFENTDRMPVPPGFPDPFGGVPQDGQMPDAGFAGMGMKGARKDPFSPIKASAGEALPAKTENVDEGNLPDGSQGNDLSAAQFVNVGSGMAGMDPGEFPIQDQSGGAGFENFRNTAADIASDTENDGAETAVLLHREETLLLISVAALVLSCLIALKIKH